MRGYGPVMSAYRRGFEDAIFEIGRLEHSVHVLLQ